MISDISDAAIEELRQAVKGTVWRRGDAGFVRHSQLFNAAIKSPAQLLVRPVDANDVAEVVKFCGRHSLSPSVKSGGYGTHGWAVEGDVVIDMRLIAQITIERPLEDVAEGEADWVSMRQSSHATMVDPDKVKGKSKGRFGSAAAYPTADPAASVGPQPIHVLCAESPHRRSADEAFENVIVVPPETQVPTHGEREVQDERPSRRLRVHSPAASSTELATPPATNSPHTPADGFDPKPSGKPFTFDEPSVNKSLGPNTTEDILHDEGMLPPSAERPGVGVDVRGYVGRDVGGWDTVWTGRALDGAVAESATGTDNAPRPSSSPLPPLRSNAPSSARPFDFGGEPSGSNAQVNAFSNPHGNPSFSSTNTSARAPFQFMDDDTPDQDNPRPHPRPNEPSAPTVTHVAFAPSAPVPHTYVTFGAGASQKDVDAFCAAHPLEAVTAETEGNYGVDGVDGYSGGIDSHPEGLDGHPARQGPLDFTSRKERPTIIADSAQPGLYRAPQATRYGPGSGSFFGPGIGIGQSSLFSSSPGLSSFGQPANPIFGSPPSLAPTIPYYVPFAAHPVGSTVMLLGGFGFLSRLRGLSMDCLVEVEMVLADGRIVWVSADGVKDEDGNQVELDDEEDDLIADEFIAAELERERRAKEKEKQKATEETESGDKDQLPSNLAPSNEAEAPPPADGEPPNRRGLWWALRGAGPAFGIVVRYKARAFPVPVVFAGNLIYNFNKSTAHSLIKHFRDCIKAAPRELYANCILTAGPRNKGALVVIQICYAGSRADGLPFLQAISSWEGEPCLLNEVQEKEFVWQQDSVAKVLKGGSGRKWFIRSDLITSLTDEIIHQTVNRFGNTPDGCTWLFELSGGALTDTTDSCLPRRAREAAFTIVALHQWKLEQDDPACVLTAEKWLQETLSPQSTGGPFPCFLERRERRARVLGVYGAENWARLCALKKKYDPTGMFRHNFWPLGEDGRPVVDPREARSGADVTSGHYMDVSLDDRGVPITM